MSAPTIDKDKIVYNESEENNEGKIKCNKCLRSFNGDEIDKHSSKDECLYSVMMEMRTTFTGYFYYSIKTFPYFNFVNKIYLR